MSRVQNHYDTLLADHYTWMSGLSFLEKVAEQRNILINLGFGPRESGRAIDLGCGPGYQSLALCELGFDSIVGWDTSRALLDELKARGSGFPIWTECADLRDFATGVEHDSIDVIVCMGDSLTHLESRDDVSRLFSDAYDVLRPTGRMVLTFRDLSQETTGLDRFIPIRADDQRIMVCVLDFEADRVTVTDLIHVRTDTGWTLYKSSYPKLRLNPAAVAEALAGIGFIVDQDRPIGRMHAIAARKP